jgi:hypothetical protein
METLFRLTLNGRLTEMEYKKIQYLLYDFFVN